MRTSSLRLVCLASASLFLLACGGSNVNGGDDAAAPDAPACVNNAQCDDGTACTIDVCQMGTCVYTPDLEGEECDDGLFCTQNTRCMAGACLGDPLDCGA